MDKELTFDELYEAYTLCLKNKKKKFGTYNFTNENLCENLLYLLDSLNNRTYVPKSSDCYVITDPALREIYAAQFSDRIVQHFYMKEIKKTIIRVSQKAKTIKYEDKNNLLAKVNSQIGTLKNYNCIKLINNYVKFLPCETKKIIKYNCVKMIFY